MKGKTVVMGIITYLGSEEKGKEFVDPYRKIATPFVDKVQMMPYAAGTQQLVTQMFVQASYYQRSRRVKDQKPSTAYIKDLAKVIASKPASAAWVSEDFSGPSQEKDSKSSSYPHRQYRYTHFFMSIYPPIPLDTKMKEAQKADHEWINKIVEKDLKDYYTTFHSAGYGMGETSEIWKAYWGDHYERLKSLKEKYDPTHLLFPLLGQ